MRLWTWAIDFRENGRFLTGEAELIAEKIAGKKAQKSSLMLYAKLHPVSNPDFLKKSITVIKFIIGTNTLEN